MHKRITIILLIFAMVFMTACSTGTKVDTTGTSQGKDAPEGPGIVELTAWVPARTSSGRTSLNWMDSKIGALLAKETGVSLTQNFITGDAEQAFNLKLASRDWEDIISTGLNFTWVDKLVSADAIIPLDNYFEMPDKYPNLAKIPEKVLDNFRYTDGHIYYFPSGWYEDENSVYGYWCAAGWYVHPEYLKAVGMSADELKTLDDVERYLELVKNAELKTQLEQLRNINCTHLNTQVNIAFPYTTPEIDAMLNAANKFWANYQDNQKEPTQKEIGFFIADKLKLEIKNNDVPRAAATYATAIRPLRFKK